MQVRKAIGSLFLSVLLLVLCGSLSATDFFASGGNGDQGGDGGDVELNASQGLRAGGKGKVKFPKDPKITRKASLTATDVDLNTTVNVADLDASPADFDPDPFQVTTDRDFLVPAGTTLEIEADVTITSTQGGIFVAGVVQDNDGNDNGADIDLRSIRKQVSVTGTIDMDGEDAVNGGNGGDIELNGLFIGVGGTATITADGGDTTAAANGGEAGSVTVESFNTLIQEKKSSIGFGPNTTVSLEGGAGDNGGDGGDFEVDFRNATRSRVALTGTIDVSGGSAAAGGNNGGEGGDIDVDVRDSVGLAGTFDARGGDGATGADGGDAGRIRVGRGVAAARRFDILGDTTLPNRPVSVDVSGGDGLVDDGGQGGDFDVENDQKAIDWVGSVDASGGASTDGDGADGGEIFFTTFGTKKSDIRVTGNLTTAGSDAGTDGQGSAGGDVELISLDGSVFMNGNVDASAGNAVGADQDANGDGGHVFFLVDDTSGLPNTDPDGVELLDNFGGVVSFEGAITTAGGNGGTGDSDGSNGGEVLIDADSDDGEQKANGGGNVDGTITTVGGDGVGTGTNGDGADITLRASNRKLDNTTPSGCTIAAGAVFTFTAGTGGTVAGVDGTQTVD